MDKIDTFRRAGLFDRTVPRYTSYPPANHFAALDAETHAHWLSTLPPGQVSLYLHIPFCERLCWFCACRTQAVNGPAPVEAYLDTLEKEIAQVASLLPAGVTVGRMHWGGGTPTIMTPGQIARLARFTRAAFPFEAGGEFSVEIDPACVSEDKIDALAQAGLNRASVGIQDFEEAVQDTIGRHQSFAQTRDVLAALRAHGVESVNADLVYGLPRQTLASLNATLDQVLALTPERIALYGYAHVPFFSKRQRVIPEDTLPDPMMRFAMAEATTAKLVGAGYDDIGIDHFAWRSDGLSRAKATGHLRRNFQGYTDDTMGALIGMGASSISRLPQGYVQNAPATPAWAERVEAGMLPAVKGHGFSEDDLLRARAIEMLMCDFELDLARLGAQTGQGTTPIARAAATIAARWPEAVRYEEGRLSIPPAMRPLTRLIAEGFDAYADPVAGRHSQAI